MRDIICDIDISLAAKKRLLASAWLYSQWFEFDGIPFGDSPSFDTYYGSDGIEAPQK